MYNYHLIRYTALLGKVCIFIFMLSCNNAIENKEAIPIINFSTIKPADLQLSSVVDSIIYIPLETNRKCILNKLTKIKIVGDKIFALNIGTNMGLYNFNMDGRFLNKVTNVGHGPGEFISIANFEVDPLTHNVFLLDSRQKKIIVLDASLGYIREIKFNKLPLNFCIDADLNLAVILDEPVGNEFVREVFVCNQDGDVLKRISVSKMNQVNRIVNSRVESYNNSLIWIDSESNKLLRYSTNIDTLLAVNMDNNKHLTLKSEGYSINEKTGNKTSAVPASYSISKLILNNHNSTYSSFGILSSKQLQKLLVTNNGQQSFLFYSIVNDINGLYVDNHLSILNNKYFYQSLNPIDIIDYNNRGIKKHNGFIDQLSANDNPVLALYRISKLQYN